MDCTGCYYYRFLDSRPGPLHVKCCYYNLDTARSRRKDADKCLEYDEREYEYSPSENTRRMWERIKAEKGRKHEKET